MTNYSLVTQYRVWDDKEGVRLVVKANSDTGFGIEIATEDKKSEEWYGKIRLTLNDKEHAIIIAQAILKAAETADWG